MDDDEIIRRLTCLWIDGSDRNPSHDEARIFLAMWREMQNIDHEIIGQKWVERSAWPRG